MRQPEFSDHQGPRWPGSLSPLYLLCSSVGAAVLLISGGLSLLGDAPAEPSAPALREAARLAAAAAAAATRPNEPVLQVAVAIPAR